MACDLQGKPGECYQSHDLRGAYQGAVDSEDKELPDGPLDLSSTR